MTTDPARDNPLGDTREQTLEQHRHIRQLAERLGDAADLVQLLQRLQEFRSAAVLHFGDEEAPEGFFEVVRSRAGRHLDKLQHLEREHQAFLGEIDGLAERARAVLAGPVAELLRLAGELARQLNDHEARENELLLDALYLDLGEES
ncbi:MAG: hypothetical protein A3I14_17525 [Candidatus Rokubacteria bacterium RIFCSPLOWO2_02_FULL_73_56]|nr:MAG: hypothetical protein A3D33_02795 [Candidatus Rokubacteria bacterium RIFCSPHIGHO2_02_FULL_73_26]OGL10470.1 MAG: hypothetical protein A3I14_17525 [Candidatus Rokubacteria bacterium RIFCSPLOWO2_02_FULL_73_56]OGL25479.1 MAG: hypothetical protein A3G44_04855 [Candidatus Rokubacteria bacterium RIFCSPLOWO2_12_FULL_73_47]